MVRFDTPGDGFAALKSGQADAQILDSLQNAAFLSREGTNFRNLPGNWSYEEICIGLPAGDVDWLRVVDTFVRQLVNSGENARLFRKYFGYDIPPM
jgi:polar amino acid transport system substrate-binding protein